MDWWQNGKEYGHRSSSAGNELNIWPIEHPTEPQDEDQPIQCPNPHPSLFNDEQFLGYPSNRTDVSAPIMMNKEEKIHRMKPMRKKHHRSSVRKDSSSSTPSVAPPRHSFSARDNLKMFPMFQKFYKNES